MVNKKKNILVTGAAGFIGSHLVQALSAKDYSVVCFVHPEDDIRHLENLGLKIIKGTLADRCALEQAVDGVEVIYHLAGILSNKDPDSVYRTNFEGTKNIVNACKSKKIQLKRFMYVSSAAVSGPTGENKMDERRQCQPVSAYGKSKLMAEEFLLSPQNSLPITIIRLVQVYGPGGLNIFYQICRVAKKGFLPDFIQGRVSVGFIDDIARGMIQACEHPGTIGEIYLLGENRIYTLSEIVQVFSSLVRQDLIRIRLPNFLLYPAVALLELFCKIKNTEVPLTRWQVRSYLRQFEWCYDISKAEKDFGYRTETSLAEGAKITVDWFLKNGHLG